MYAPSMLYSLPAVASHEDDLSSIQTELMGVALQKLRASSKTPSEIRHGPYELGGLNIKDLSTETGIARIKLLRDDIYTDSEVGRLIILGLKATQLEAGIKTLILEFPDIPLPYITSTWITSLRTFLALHNIKISITDTLSVRYSNHCNECIMNLKNLKGYTTSQQRDINWVRLHLRVITLSNMSQPGGTDIFPSMLKGDRESTTETDRHSKRWPRQPQPSVSQRRLWTRYIQAHYLRHGTKWRRPLGAIVPPHTAQNFRLTKYHASYRTRKQGPTTQQHPSNSLSNGSLNGTKDYYEIIANLQAIFKCGERFVHAGG